ncbi:MFS transporter [Trinickia caryophylli]|uniref:Sugar phosphate permease n=1 Tax=Trinickia caryophylli TaxID=28094 RepID=A0A1X7CUV1_TRICW|nr:MFS transporter [Trinickia caryophylli]PMS13401.1 MFS transporter [Trinickia caryophylli]TRX13738.1 MFS transporter [Trinickia caryophylli]WQE15330.1 MFS transporter [Trinickia caryophylli]SMF03555.1 Sugar phosphate permease [Trinickia caryophylli]GLU30912.1 MFS transporter [Trinickia caryophylli]
MDIECLVRGGLAAQPLAASRHRWKVLAVGVMANASFSAAAAGIPTTAVWMRADYRLDNASLGWVLGCMGLGLALSELPWGVATDRLGDRPVLLTGLLATALALFAMAFVVVPTGAFVPAVAVLAAAMCAVGLLGGSVNGSSGRAVMSWFGPSEHGLAMSIRQTAVPLGGGLGAALLPWLASAHGFAAVFATLAFMCAASACFAWYWLKAPPLTDAAFTRAHAVAPACGPLADLTIWRVAFGIGSLCIPQFAVLTFASVFLHDFGRLGTAGISATMAAIQIGAMGMRVWSGRHTDRHGNRRAYLRASTLVAAASFAGLAFVVAAVHPAPTGLLVAMIIAAGICISAWHGVAYAELATLAGAQRAGTALGMANTIVYAGLFVAPSAIPPLLDAGSWGTVWLSAGIVALAARPLFPR